MPPPTNDVEKPPTNVNKSRVAPIPYRPKAVSKSKRSRGKLVGFIIAGFIIFMAVGLLSFYLIRQYLAKTNTSSAQVGVSGQTSEQSMSVGSSSTSIQNNLLRNSGKNDVQLGQDQGNQRKQATASMMFDENI